MSCRGGMFELKPMYTLKVIKNVFTDPGRNAVSLGVRDSGYCLSLKRSEWRYRRLSCDGVEYNDGDIGHMSETWSMCYLVRCSRAHRKYDKVSHLT